MAVLGRDATRIRVDRRTLLGIALAAAAAFAVLMVTRPAPTAPILVAATDLPMGTPLADSSVSVREVTSADGLLEGNGLGELSGWTLAAPVPIDDDAPDRQQGAGPELDPVDPLAPGDVHLGRGSVGSLEAVGDPDLVGSRRHAAEGERAVDAHRGMVAVALAPDLNEATARPAATIVVSSTSTW